jgi:TolB protein
MRVLIRMTLILFLTATTLIVAMHGFSLLAGDDHSILLVSKGEKQHSIQLADINQGLRINLMQNSFLAGESVWSHNHRILAVVSYWYNPDGNLDIFVTNVNTQGIYNLTSHAGNDYSPVWSPDSTRIAFVSDRDGNHEIYVVDVGGENLQKLTDHPSNDREPQWSPDGTMIAFISKRDGNDDVFVMDADGGNLRNLTNHPSSDYAPLWSPDSQIIAFISHRDGNREIYVVNVHTQTLDSLADASTNEYSMAWHTNHDPG